MAPTATVSEIAYREARGAIQKAIENQLGRDRLFAIYETTIQAPVLCQPSLLGLLLIAVAPESLDGENPDLVLMEPNQVFSSIPVYEVPATKTGLDLIAQVFSAILAAPRETFALDGGGEVEIIVLDDLIFSAAKRLAVMGKATPEWLVVTTKDTRRPFNRGASPSFSPEIAGVAREDMADLIAAIPGAVGFADRLKAKFIEVFGEGPAAENPDLFAVKGKLPEVILRRAPEVRVNFLSCARKATQKLMLPPPVSPPYVFGVIGIRPSTSAPCEGLVLHSYSKQAALDGVGNEDPEADLDTPSNARVLVTLAEEAGIPRPAAIARVSKALGVPADACVRVGFPLTEVLPYVMHSPSERVLSAFVRSASDILSRSGLSGATASKALPHTSLALLIAASLKDWRLDNEENPALVTITSQDAEHLIVTDIRTDKPKRVDRLLIAIEKTLSAAKTKGKKLDDVLQSGQEAIDARYAARGISKPGAQPKKSVIKLVY